MDSISRSVGPPQDVPAGALRLFGETVAPVAHPSLGLSTLDTQEELEEQVLLEFEDAYRPWLRWSEWLSCQGWEDLKPKGVLRYNHYDQMIHAAIAGQGVALGRLELVGLMLAEGRLAIVSLPAAGAANGQCLLADPHSFLHASGSRTSRAMDHGRSREGHPLNLPPHSSCQRRHIR